MCPSIMHALALTPPFTQLAMIAMLLSRIYKETEEGGGTCCVFVRALPQFLFPFSFAILTSSVISA